MCFAHPDGPCTDFVRSCCEEVLQLQGRIPTLDDLSQNTETKKTKNSQREKLQGKNYDITTEIKHDQNYDLTLEHQFSTVENAFCMWKNMKFLKLSKEQILTSAFCFPHNISVSLHQSYPDICTQIPHWTGWPSHQDHEHQPTPWSSPTYKRKDSKCFTLGLPNSNQSQFSIGDQLNCCSTNVLTTMNLDYIVIC